MTPFISVTFLVCAIVYVILRIRRKRRTEEISGVLELVPLVRDLTEFVDEYKVLYIKSELLRHNYAVDMNLVWNNGRRNEKVSLAGSPEQTAALLEDMKNQTAENILLAVSHIAKWYAEQCAYKPDYPLEPYEPVYPPEEPETDGVTDEYHKMWYFAFKDKGNTMFTIECFTDSMSAFERRLQLQLEGGNSIVQITDVVYMTGKMFLRKLNEGEIKVWEK